MKLTVLGSGTPTSGFDRACAGYLVESQQNVVVLDLGTGAFKNLQKAIHPGKVNVLFFSHYSHTDHSADFIGFLSNRRLFCKENPNEARQLNIFGAKGTEAFVKKSLELFPSLSKLNFPIWVEEMQYSSKKIFGFTVKSKPLKHAEDSIGFRIEAEGKIIAYSGDTEYCDEIIDLGKDADLLILECTFPGTEKKEGHLNPKECGEIAKKADAKRLLVSHLGIDAEKEDLKKEIKKAFSREILLAKDLLEIEV